MQNTISFSSISLRTAGVLFGVVMSAAMVGASVYWPATYESRDLNQAVIRDDAVAAGKTVAPEVAQVAHVTKAVRG